jgi:hypothetical protein
MPSYEEVTQRAGSLRSMTGLTEAEFMALLPHFEQAFVVYMQDRTIDGQPRTSRRYTTYDTCPLQTSPKFPLHWWGINSTLSGYISLTSHQSRTAAGESPRGIRCQDLQICGVILTRYGRLESPRV